MFRWLIIFAVLAVGLAACGGARTDPGAGAGSPAADPDAPVATAVPATPAPPATPELVRPSPGMEQVHPVRWRSAQPVGDGSTVEVTWVSGVRPCYVLDHVEVDTGSERVVITLFEGSAPTDEPVACIELAKTKRTRVQLDRPLGDRGLVDGAPTPAG